MSSLSCREGGAPGEGGPNTEPDLRGPGTLKGKGSTCNSRHYTTQRLANMVFFPLILRLCSSSRQVALSGATLTDGN